MATTAPPAPGDLPPTTPSTRRGSGNWKHRFLRRGSSSRQNSSAKSDPTLDQSTHTETEEGVIETSSLATKRNSLNAKKKKVPGIIRKLKTSFRREDSSARLEDEEEEDTDPIVVDGDSSSPSNPQSPYSTESLNTVEVRMNEGINEPK
jgi:hypothetical protein